MMALDQLSVECDYCQAMSGDTYTISARIVALRRRLTVASRLGVLPRFVFALQHVEGVSHETPRAALSVARRLLVVLAIGKVVLVVGHGDRTTAVRVRQGYMQKRWNERWQEVDENNNTPTEGWDGLFFKRDDEGREWDSARVSFLLVVSGAPPSPSPVKTPPIHLLTNPLRSNVHIMDEYPYWLVLRSQLNHGHN